jgi:chloride channel 7
VNAHKDKIILWQQINESHMDRAIGAIYGRMLGEVSTIVLAQFITSTKDSTDWEWVDPGAFALLGAASFLSGTSRLPITSVVMMVKLTIK